MDSFYFSGLLKPYWYKIEQQIFASLSLDQQIKISEDIYYLEESDELLDWYWYTLILFISGLFFYRMIEAAIKEIRTLNRFNGKIVP